jgi:hypothetical protein
MDIDHVVVARGCFHDNCTDYKYDDVGVWNCCQGPGKDYCNSGEGVVYGVPFPVIGFMLGLLLLFEDFEN